MESDLSGKRITAAPLCVLILLGSCILAERMHFPLTIWITSVMLAASAVCAAVIWIPRILRSRRQKQDTPKAAAAGSTKEKDVSEPRQAADSGNPGAAGEPQKQPEPEQPEDAPEKETPAAAEIDEAAAAASRAKHSSHARTMTHEEVEMLRAYAKQQLSLHSDQARQQRAAAETSRGESSESGMPALTENQMADIESRHRSR